MTQVLRLLDPGQPERLEAEPLDLNLASVGVEVDLAGEITPQVAADHRDVLDLGELLDELHVALSDTAPPVVHASDARATEESGLNPAPIRSRLQHGPDQEIHGVDAVPPGLPSVITPAARRRQHEVVHPTDARDQVVEAHGDAGTENSPQNRGLARNVHPADVDDRFRPLDRKSHSADPIRRPSGTRCGRGSEARSASRAATPRRPGRGSRRAGAGRRTG